MLKNIQKKIRLSHPTVWNIRLLPMILCLIVLNLLCVLVGYVATNTDFARNFETYSGLDLQIFYLCSVLIGVVIFIVWTVFFNRNNALKYFYPRKVGQLYAEWFFTFVIASFIIFLPMAVDTGKNLKWKSLCSREDVAKTKELLDKITIIMPTSSSYDDYSYDEKKDTPIKVKREDQYNRAYSYSDYSYIYDEDGNRVPHYYIGESFVYSKNYYYNNRKHLSESVAKLFEDGDEEGVRNLILEYQDLLKKHNLFDGTISANNWMERIYRAPYFRVDSYVYFEGVYDCYSDSPNDKRKLRYLEDGYDQVENAYDSLNHFSSEYFAFLQFMLCLSLIVFSFRISNLRSWLIGLCIGVGLIILFALYLFCIDKYLYINRRTEDLCVIVYVLVIYISSFILYMRSLMTKVKTKLSEFSQLIFLWMHSTFIFIGYLTVLSLNRFIDDDYYSQWDFEKIQIVNLVCVILTMIPIMMSIKKFKSLPNE